MCFWRLRLASAQSIKPVFLNQPQWFRASYMENSQTAVKVPCQYYPRYCAMSVMVRIEYVYESKLWPVVLLQQLISESPLSEHLCYCLPGMFSPSLRHILNAPTWAFIFQCQMLLINIAKRTFFILCHS